MRKAPSSHLRSSGRAALVEPLEHRRLLAAGDPDNSFGSGGVATIDFPGTSFHINDVALQSDGKVVAVGTKGGNLAVARLNVNGSLDTSFGNQGLFESTARPNVTAVAIQGDDKIVMALAGDFNAHIAPSVARLSANGFWDASFGTSGIAPVAASALGALALAIQQDGKIVAAGHTGGEADFVIARLDTSGAPDSSFSGDGYQTAGFGGSETASAIAIDYNGTPGTNPFYETIVVVGINSINVGPPPTRVTICRLLSDGSFDNRFDSDGKLTSPDLSPQPGESATGVQIQAGGKIVVTGTALAIAGSFQTGDFLVARYLSNGVIDTTFGPFGTGIVQTDFGGDERAIDSAPSYFGGFLVSGRQDSAAAVAAYTRDGLLEARFGGGDGFMTAFGGIAHVATTLDTIEPVRRMVLGGGNRVGRYIDVGTVVNFPGGFFSQETNEATGPTLNVRVERLDLLPTTQRIYINLGGTATPPTSPQFLNWDYTTSGITLAGLNVPRSYVEIPAGQTFKTFSITPINDNRPEGDETILISISPDPTYDISTPSSTTLMIRDDDVIGGPTVAESRFLYETAPQRVAFRFNQNVASSIGANDFQVSGPTGNVPFSFAYDSTLNTATLTFSGILPDGDFSARAIAAGITNASGQPMPADHVFDFFFLRGDANHDRSVNLQDFNILAANFGQSSRDFTQGDFNYDTMVTLPDFNILAGRFGQVLAAEPFGSNSIRSTSSGDELRRLLEELT